MHKQPAIDGRLINCTTKDDSSLLDQLRRWSDVKKTFHSTRHTFASRLAMKVGPYKKYPRKVVGKS